MDADKIPAVASPTDNILKAFDEKKYTVGLLSKAYDSIDHPYRNKSTMTCEEQLKTDAVRI